MFRIIDRLSPTLIIDEADWNRTSEFDTITKILNAGYRKGGVVFRSKEVKRGGTKSFDPTFFQVYGCKVIASRYRFADEALESRCIPFDLHCKEIPSHIPLQLPVEAYSEAQELRDRLLGWRFRNWEEVEIQNYPDGFAMEARFKECFQPLYSLFGDEILQAARIHREHMKAHLSTSLQAEVIVAIDTLLPSKSRIYMRDIAEEAGTDPQTAGRIVRELGFEKRRDRNGVYLVENEELLGMLAKNYYLSPTVEA